MEHGLLPETESERSQSSGETESDSLILSDSQFKDLVYLFSSDGVGTQCKRLASNLSLPSVGVPWSGSAKKFLSNI